MRTFSTLCMTLLLGAACMTANADNKSKFAEKFKKVDIHNLVSAPGMVNRSNSAYQFNKAGFASVASNAPVRRADENAASVSLSSQSYGWITGANGQNWYYTQSYVTRDSVYSEYYTAKFIESSEITFYDNTHTEVGKISVTVPENFKHVGSVSIYGITKKLFDTNEKTYEVMVEIHDAINGENQYLTRAYRIGTSDILFEKEGTGIIFDASKDWNTYQRLVMTNETDGNYVLDIYASPTWGKSEAWLEHTFSMPIDNRINYLQGPSFNCFNLNGTPYYVLCSYEKPFTEVDASESDQDITQVKGNYVRLYTYDKKYNLVDSIKVSIDPESDDVPYRTAAFGLFGNNDLSKGYFTDNGNLNYVVELHDYTPSLDGDLISFAVYDSKNGKLKDICDKVSDSQWATLNTIHGKSDQMWFLQTIGTSSDNSTQQIQIVDVPSCEKATVLPATIDGNSISSNFDRYATTANAAGYQYVIALSKSELAEDSSILAPIAWVNPDCTIDHKDVINLGPDAEYFTPLINSTSLNPYLFNTDDDMEYVYIAKKRRTDGSNKIDNVLEVAKTDGTVLQSWRGDDNRPFTSASIPVMDENGKQELVVVFTNYETGLYDMSFYTLPFSKFSAGGDGSVENPYLISTVGDFQQMAMEPTKNYKIINDLDMSKAANYWTPISSFTGSLDGDGHTIYNLGIKGTSSHVGIFGTLDTEATAKNFTLVNPDVIGGSSAQFVGTVAGEAIYANSNKYNVKNIDSVFVYNANIDVDNDAVVGGIAGCASLNTMIVNSAFNGTINAPEAEMTGGIAGQSRTGSTISACYANADITANTQVGGILGKGGSVQDCINITNCEARGTINAKNTIGGIIGDSYWNNINNNISHVTINATEASRWAGYATGGIIGWLQSDWGTSYTTHPFANNIADTKITAYADGVEVENASTTHQIVGKSIADETYYDGETPQTEGRLEGNYTTYGNGSDATTVDGAYKALADMNKDFFTGLNFAYGQTLSEPWKETSATTPTLYYNNIARALAVNMEDITVGTTDEGIVTVKVSVYGDDNADLESDLDITPSNKNVSVSMGKSEGNTIELNIKGLKQGLSVVTVKYGDLTATINVTVISGYTSDIEGIDNAEALVIKAKDGKIAAEGADAISVYSLNGQLVAKVAANELSTSGLTSGLYIVKAADNNGHKAAAKVMIK